MCWSKCSTQGGCSFVKSPLVTNEMGDILGKRGLLFVEVKSIGCRVSCCCRLSRTRILEDWCSDLDLRSRNDRRWPALPGAALGVPRRRG